MKMAAMILNAGGWVPFSPMIFAPKVIQNSCNIAGAILKNFIVAENSWFLLQADSDWERIGPVLKWLNDKDNANAPPPFDDDLVQEANTYKWPLRDGYHRR
jgi:hypothetical protein